MDEKPHYFLEWIGVGKRAIVQRRDRIIALLACDRDEPHVFHPLAGCKQEAVPDCIGLFAHLFDQFGIVRKARERPAAGEAAVLLFVKAMEFFCLRKVIGIVLELVGKTDALAVQYLMAEHPPTQEQVVGAESADVLVRPANGGPFFYLGPVDVLDLVHRQPLETIAAMDNDRYSGPAEHDFLWPTLGIGECLLHCRLLFVLQGPIQNRRFRLAAQQFLEACVRTIGFVVDLRRKSRTLLRIERAKKLGIQQFRYAAGIRGAAHYYRAALDGSNKGAVVLFIRLAQAFLLRRPLLCYRLKLLAYLFERSFAVGRLHFFHDLLCPVFQFSQPLFCLVRLWLPLLLGSVEFLRRDRLLLRTMATTVAK
jgi:hypothetical protein